jgi:hypothetical protein
MSKEKQSYSVAVLRNDNPGSIRILNTFNSLNRAKKYLYNYMIKCALLYYQCECKIDDCDDCKYKKNYINNDVTKFEDFKKSFKSIKEEEYNEKIENKHYKYIGKFDSGKGIKYNSNGDFIIIINTEDDFEKGY